MFTKALLDKLRAETPGTAHCIHFNNAGAALPPLTVLQAQQDHLQLEATIGGYEAAVAKQQDIQQFYESIATLLNTRPNQIAYAHNATQAFNTALSAIPFEKGDIVLTTLDDYVSNQIAFLQLQKRFGVQVLHAPNQAASGGGGVDMEAMAQLIRAKHPKLVAATHIPTNSGLIQPVEAIGALCRESGSWYLVDACQSAGQVPLDVEVIGCDFLTASMRKYLRGPRGAGFLYVSERALQEGLEPLFLDLHSASWSANHHYQAADTARRFEIWERSYASVLGSAAAVQYALDVGVADYSERLCQLAAFARMELAKLEGVRVLDRGEYLGGIVTIHIEGVAPQDLKSALQDRGINTSLSFRDYARFDFEQKGVDWALRISPHYYNLESEVEELVGIIQEKLLFLH